MADIRYLAPNSLDEAVGAYAAAGSAARILAGGTDLLVQMRSGAQKPGVIVDIKKIPEMTTITDLGGGAFRFTLEIIHPRFGRLIRQSAVFREASS